ncbi:hypothetical protein [Bacillus sp. OV322]|uniref:VgrG-related protein n=1 Tax=Bacillus sp. OV322 TaxID=1882764 RepID=UPI003527F22A
MDYNSSFVSAWSSVYNKDKTGFYQEQHDFIKYSHYDPVVKQVKAQYCYDASTKSLAIQEIFWSSAVQHRALYIKGYGSSNRKELDH